MKTLKVLLIGPSYPDEDDVTRHNHVHNQLLRYHEAAIEPTMLELVPSRPGIRREKFQTIDVIRFGLLPGGLKRSFVFRTLYTQRLRSLLKEIIADFDLVHAQTATPQLASAIEALGAKPLVITCNGDDVYPSKIPSLERKRRLLLNRADLAIGISNYTAELISHYLANKNKLHVVPVGLRDELFHKANERTPEDVRRELGLPLDRKIVLMACSLIERKGVFDVLQAFHKTQRLVPQAYLVVVGQGSEKQRMIEYIRENQLDQHVIMIDYIKDDQTMAYYYRASDLYVMFSKTVENKYGAGVEGFGISYIDANAVGIPVIGGKSGGVANAVIDEETGFLVDPTSPNAVEQLHQRMHELLTSDSLRRKMGEAGQKRVFAELTWSMNVKRTRELYDSVVRSDT